VPPPCEHSDQAQTWTYLPGPATALTKVRHRQTHELVAARFELHLLEQFAGAAHVLGMLGCLVMQLVDLPHEAITKSL
jgi:hypothetical protein